MNRICWIFVILMSSPIAGWAQSVISGKVLDERTGAPLSGASVYINSSSVGAITNEEGRFELKPVSDGFYEVVASYVGYERVVYRATVQSKNLSIMFKISPKVDELRKVVVLPKSDREKWLKVLRENFLGTTLAASRTKIVNEEDILFEEGTSRSAILAFSAAPLEIVNRELGYRIFFELESFYYDAREGRTFFYGYSRFEELSEKEKVPQKYQRERERYYRGSTMHFYHALIDDKLEPAGFAIRNVRNSKVEDSVQDSANTGLGIRIGGRGMRVSYPISRTDFFRTDTVSGTRVYVLDWKDNLRVTYNKNPYGKTYLQRKVSFMQGNMPKGVYSEIEMLKGPAYLDGNGCLYDPLAVQMQGFWSYEKLANMLPINYRPD